MTPLCCGSDLDRWSKLLRSEKGDPAPDVFIPRDDFALMLVNDKDETLRKELAAWFSAIKVRDGDYQHGKRGSRTRTSILCS